MVLFNLTVEQAIVVLSVINAIGVNLTRSIRGLKFSLFLPLSSSRLNVKPLLSNVERCTLVLQMLVEKI